MTAPTLPGTLVRQVSTKNMVELPGGAFRMGSDRFYREERPVREVEVDGF